jgi:hypothetical protein
MKVRKKIKIIRAIKLFDFFEVIFSNETKNILYNLKLKKK